MSAVRLSALCRVPPRACEWWGAEGPLSGPELTFQCRGGLVERARVGAGREVLPAAVAHDEGDVGLASGRHLLVGDAERSVQDGTGRDAGEDALALDQL